MTTVTFSGTGVATAVAKPTFGTFAVLNSGTIVSGRSGAKASAGLLAPLPTATGIFPAGAGTAIGVSFCSNLGRIGTSDGSSIASATGQISLLYNIGFNGSGQWSVPTNAVTVQAEVWGAGGAGGPNGGGGGGSGGYVTETYPAKQTSFAYQAVSSQENNTIQHYGFIAYNGIQQPFLESVVPDLNSGFDFTSTYFYFNVNTSAQNCILNLYGFNQSLLMNISVTLGYYTLSPNPYAPSGPYQSGDPWTPLTGNVAPYATFDLYDAGVIGTNVTFLGYVNGIGLANQCYLQQIDVSSLIAWAADNLPNSIIGNSVGVVLKLTALTNPVTFTWAVPFGITRIDSSVNSIFNYTVGQAASGSSGQNSTISSVFDTITATGGSLSTNSTGGAGGTPSGHAGSNASGGTGGAGGTAQNGIGSLGGTGGAGGTSGNAGSIGGFPGGGAGGSGSGVSGQSIGGNGLVNFSYIMVTPTGYATGVASATFVASPAGVFFSSGASATSSFVTNSRKVSTTGLAIGNFLSGAVTIFSGPGAATVSGVATASPIGTAVGSLADSGYFVGNGITATTGSATGVATGNFVGDFSVSPAVFTVVGAGTANGFTNNMTGSANGDATGSYMQSGSQFHVSGLTTAFGQSGSQFHLFGIGSGIFVSNSGPPLPIEFTTPVTVDIHDRYFPTMWVPGINLFSDQATDLKFALPMWEASGQLMYDVVGGMLGQAPIAPNTFGQSQYKLGDNAFNSYFFNTSYVNFGNTTFDFTNGFAFSFWQKIYDTTTNELQYYFSFNEFSFSVSLIDAASGSYVFALNYLDANGSVTNVEWELSGSLNVWQHIAVSGSGTNISLYVDGELLNTTTTTYAAAIQSGNLILGSSSTVLPSHNSGYTLVYDVPSTSFIGSLKDFRIYTKPLLIGDVKRINRTPEDLYSSPLAVTNSFVNFVQSVGTCLGKSNANGQSGSQFGLIGIGNAFGQSGSQFNVIGIGNANAQSCSRFNVIGIGNVSGQSGSQFNVSGVATVNGSFSQTYQFNVSGVATVNGSFSQTYQFNVSGVAIVNGIAGFIFRASGASIVNGHAGSQFNVIGLATASGAANAGSAIVSATGTSAGASTTSFIAQAVHTSVATAVGDATGSVMKSISRFTLLASPNANGQAGSQYQLMPLSIATGVPPPSGSNATGIALTQFQAGSQFHFSGSSAGTFVGQVPAYSVGTAAGDATGSYLQAGSQFHLSGTSSSSFFIAVPQFNVTGSANVNFYSYPYAILVPIADKTTLGFTGFAAGPVPAGQLYTTINEGMGSFSDGSYVVSGGTNKTLSFTLGSLPFDVTTVLSVSIVARLANSGTTSPVQEWSSVQLFRTDGVTPLTPDTSFADSSTLGTVTITPSITGGNTQAIWTNPVIVFTLNSGTQSGAQLTVLQLDVNYIQGISATSFAGSDSSFNSSGPGIATTVGSATVQGYRGSIFNITGLTSTNMRAGAMFTVVGTAIGSGRTFSIFNVGGDATGSYMLAGSRYSVQGLASTLGLVGSSFGITCGSTANSYPVLSSVGESDGMATCSAVTLSIAQGAGSALGSAIGIFNAGSIGVSFGSSAASGYNTPATSVYFITGLSTANAQSGSQLNGIGTGTATGRAGFIGRANGLAIGYGSFPTNTGSYVTVSTSTAFGQSASVFNIKGDSNCIIIAGIGITTILVPVSDYSVSNFNAQTGSGVTTSNLYLTINEGTSSPNDGNYVSSTSPNANTAQFTLGTIPSNIGLVTGIVITIRSQFVFNFSGDEQDWSTCQIFQSDGVTPLTSVSSIADSFSVATSNYSPSLIGTTQSAWNNAIFAITTNSVTTPYTAPNLMAVQVALTYTPLTFGVANGDATGSYMQAGMKASAQGAASAQMNSISNFTIVGVATTSFAAVPPSSSGNGVAIAIGRAGFIASAAGVAIVSGVARQFIFQSIFSSNGNSVGAMQAGMIANSNGIASGSFVGVNPVSSFFTIGGVALVNFTSLVPVFNVTGSATVLAFAKGSSVFTTGNSFLVPFGFNSLQIEIWGGGGGGGGGGDDSGAGGGGGGGYSSQTLISVSGGLTVVGYNVGSAGTSGVGRTAPGGTGGTGGTTTVSSPVTMSATGGNGGFGGDTAQNGAGGTGGAGTTTIGSTVVNSPGATGASNGGLGGNGGSGGGNGGSGGIAPGGAGNIPGGGGAGNRAQQSGGLGSVGQIKFTYQNLPTYVFNVTGDASGSYMQAGMSALANADSSALAIAKIGNSGVANGSSVANAVMGAIGSAIGSAIVTGRQFKVPVVGSANGDSTGSYMQAGSQFVLSAASTTNFVGQIPTSKATFNVGGMAFVNAYYSILVTFTTGTSQTWTVPAGVSTIQVELWGAGGGGGGTFTDDGRTGAGGGGGGYLAKANIAVIGGTTVFTYTIGNGGVGEGINGIGGGSAGGNSILTFTDANSVSVNMVAGGGQRGDYATTGAAGGTNSGSTIPPGGVPDYNFSGQQGGNGLGSGNTLGGKGGNGSGMSGIGTGGAGGAGGNTTSSLYPQDGTIPGGGGGGAARMIGITPQPTKGGNGANGQVTFSHAFIFVNSSFNINGDSTSTIQSGSIAIALGSSDSNYFIAPHLVPVVGSSAGTATANFVNINQITGTVIGAGSSNFVGVSKSTGIGNAQGQAVVSGVSNFIINGTATGTCVASVLGLAGSLFNVTGSSTCLNRSGSAGFVVGISNSNVVGNGPFLATANGGSSSNVVGSGPSTGEADGNSNTNYRGIQVTGLIGTANADSQTNFVSNGLVLATANGDATGTYAVAGFQAIANGSSDAVAHQIHGITSFNVGGQAFVAGMWGIPTAGSTTYSAVGNWNWALDNLTFIALGRIAPPIYVQLWAGGGGGGAGVAGTAGIDGGSGGGGGGYYHGTWNGGTSMQITVGAGGTGGVSNVSNGAGRAGGNTTASSFFSGSVYAQGGGGGLGGTGFAGELGGQAGGFLFQNYLPDSAVGQFGQISTQDTGGAGGSSNAPFNAGQGGAIDTGSGPGIGTNFGGGGAGSNGIHGIDGGNNVPGASGAQGMAIVTWGPQFNINAFAGGGGVSGRAVFTNGVSTANAKALSFNLTIGTANTDSNAIGRIGVIGSIAGQSNVFGDGSLFAGKPIAIGVATTNFLSGSLYFFGAFATANAVGNSGIGAIGTANGQAFVAVRPKYALLGEATATALAGSSYNKIAAIATAKAFRGSYYIVTGIATIKKNAFNSGSQMVPDVESSAFAVGMPRATGAGHALGIAFVPNVAQGIHQTIGISTGNSSAFANSNSIFTSAFSAVGNSTTNVKAGVAQQSVFSATADSETNVKTTTKVTSTFAAIALPRVFAIAGAKGKAVGAAIVAGTGSRIRNLVATSLGVATAKFSSGRVGISNGTSTTNYKSKAIIQIATNGSIGASSTATGRIGAIGAINATATTAFVGLKVGSKYTVTGLASGVAHPCSTFHSQGFAAGTMRAGFVASAHGQAIGSFFVATPAFSSGSAAGQAIVRGQSGSKYKIVGVATVVGQTGSIANALGFATTDFIRPVPTSVRATAVGVASAIGRKGFIGHANGVAVTNVITKPNSIKNSIATAVGTSTTNYKSKTFVIKTSDFNVTAVAATSYKSKVKILANSVASATGVASTNYHTASKIKVPVLGSAIGIASATGRYGSIGHAAGAATVVGSYGSIGRAVGFASTNFKLDHSGFALGSASAIMYYGTIVSSTGSVVGLATALARAKSRFKVVGVATASAGNSSIVPTRTRGTSAGNSTTNFISRVQSKFIVNGTSTTNFQAGSVVIFSPDGGNTTTSGSANSSYVLFFDTDIIWQTQQDITITRQFTWNTGTIVQQWYQVQGACRQINNCDTLVNIVDNSCNNQFVQTFLARGLNDLCNQLSNSNFNWQIASVKVWSLPASEISNGNNNGACNILSDVPICQIPECLNFCVQTDALISMKMTASVVETFFTYTGSGGAITGGTGSPSLVGGTTSGVSFAFSSDGGTTTTGGTAVTSSSWKNDLSVSMKMSVSVADLQVVFGDGGNVPALTLPPQTIPTSCGICDNMPVIIFMQQNLVQDGVLFNFLQRNGLTLPSTITMYYNVLRSSWVSNFHLNGLSVDNLGSESWRFTYEWGCVSGQDTWKFSMLCVRKNSELTLDTRFSTTFPADQICLDIQNLEFNFSFVLNTLTESVITGDNIGANTILMTDNIGLFKSKFWANNPEFNVILSKSGTVVTESLQDISPIFPKTSIISIQSGIFVSG